MEQSETVAVSDLQVRYGSLLALSIKSLMIHASSGVIGLFGPNGAGKSTFLRTVSGDIGRFAGRISKPPRHRVAYLPDEPFLYRWMKVAQCAQLFASRHDDFRPAVFERFLEGSKITANKRVSSCRAPLTFTCWMNPSEAWIPLCVIICWTLSETCDPRTSHFCSAPTS